MVVGSREQAQRLMDRVRSGEDFATLARAESVDPSAGDGGLLGRIAISTLRPDLQTALRGLSAGQMTPIVQIPTGLCVHPRGARQQSACDDQTTQPGAPRDRQREIRARRRRLARSGNRSARVPKAGNLESGSADDLSDAPRFARRRPTALRRLLLAADGSDSKHAHAVRADAGAPRPGATACVRRRSGACAATFSGGLAVRDERRAGRAADGGRDAGHGALSQGRNGQRRVSHPRRVVPDSDAARTFARQNR